MMKTKSIEKMVVIVEKEDDDDGIDQQQLCCLQTLKFSIENMHLVIARPNLVKLIKPSKDLDGFTMPTTIPRKQA